MPAPVANYFVEQGRGVFRKGGIVPKPPLWVARNVWIPHNSTQNWAMPPLFGIWVENLGRKTAKSDYDLNEDFFLFFWSSPKSGQKNGLNLSENLCFLSSSIWSSCFSSGFIYLFKFLATRLAPLFENPAYATRTGVGNLYPLGCIRPAISNIHPRFLMWLPEVVGHATKSCSETTPTFDETFFFS